MIGAHQPKTLDEAIQLAYTLEKFPTFLKTHEKKGKESLMLIESDDSLVEEVPKRNGGVQQVSLCTIMQHLNNNNKQITSLINNKFESLKQNNQHGFPPSIN